MSTGPAADRDEPAPRVDDLPSAVRARLLQWAADTLGSVSPGELPAALGRVARFAPAKRARLAGPALAQALDADPGFRALVAAYARPDGASDGALEDALDAGSDVTSAAALAYLLRLPDRDGLLDRVRRAEAAAGSRAEVNELQQKITRLLDRVDRLIAERDAARRALTEKASAAPAEVELRRRLREQGGRLREAEQRAEAAAASAERSVAELAVELDRVRAEAAEWRGRAESAGARADAAQQTLARLRESAGSRRAAEDRRLELLLGTVESAAAGLRREWNLTGGGADPADVVAAGWPGQGVRGEHTADASRLAMWLALPWAHMIVDGYNVTKTAFAELSLADQRDRLIRLVSALAARTSVDVTVVFDGAAVAVARPAGRGVRTLFSPSGVTADDVIKDLVAAEPLGRVVIVVSADREVIHDVRRYGAYTAGSGVLLALLGA